MSASGVLLNPSAFALAMAVVGLLESLLTARRVALHLVGTKLPVENVLRSAGHLSPREDLHLYRTEAEALRACAALRGETQE